MEDKFYWKTLLSTILMVAVILIMFFACIWAVNQIENDKDVWFHKDIKWNSCSCSTELPQYFEMCMEFIKDCEVTIP